MKNIGFVAYEKGDEPGILTARWEHSDYGTGTGIAEGSPSEGFEGEYVIRYFDTLGALQAERNLSIEKRGESYRLSWFHDGRKTAEGIGRIISRSLCVGYHDV
jgi:hypothetical protein